MAVGSFSQWCACALKDLRSCLTDETLRRGIIAFRLEGGGCAPAQEQDEYGSGGPDMHLTLPHALSSHAFYMRKFLKVSHVAYCRDACNLVHSDRAKRRPVGSEVATVS